MDVQLIADLHKSEVFTVGNYLEVPQEILSAPPSADLWEGQTDEEVIYNNIKYPNSSNIHINNNFIFTLGYWIIL